MSIWKRLAEYKVVRKIVYAIVGIFSYPGLMIVNKLKISGTEHIANLPKKNVLFVSNHQTYFADVITFLHIFCAIKWRKENRLGIPYYLLNPFTSVYYVAAEETMKSTWISRLFTLAGAITVLAIGSVGMIITPNGIGAYQLLIAKLMVLYGLDEKTTGTASGWLLWSAQTFIILIGGLICFALISRYNKKRAILETT